MKVVSINKEYTTKPVSLEEIFNMTGANLEEEILNMNRSLEGGKWFPLPEPILVDTLAGPKYATDVWLNGVTNYIDVELSNGAKLTPTHHHKFLVKDSIGRVEWKMSIDLEIGDELQYKDGTFVAVQTISVTDDKAVTMDINVEEVHHYILEDGLVSHNSSISGATTNGIYPIRNLYLNKTNETMSVNYVVPDSTRLKNKYESAWNVPTNDLIDDYCIIQKWTDQAISADGYRKIQGDDKVTSSEMLGGYFRRYKFGNKQKYYQNSLTTKGIDLNASENLEEENHDDQGGNCSSGGCSL